MTESLRGKIADCLALRRALGYRLERPEKLLGQFLDHLEQHGEEVITVASALDWAQLSAGAASNWWAYRLGVVRGFATYLHAIDPLHEVPATGLLPQRPLRASPYDPSHRAQGDRHPSAQAEKIARDRPTDHRAAHQPVLATHRHQRPHRRAPPGARPLGVPCLRHRSIAHYDHSDTTAESAASSRRLAPTTTQQSTASCTSL